MSQGTKRFLN